GRTDAHMLERQTVGRAKRLARKMRPSRAPIREQTRRSPDEFGALTRWGPECIGTLEAGKRIGALEGDPLRGPRRPCRLIARSPPAKSRPGARSPPGQGPRRAR